MFSNWSGAKEENVTPLNKTGWMVVESYSLCTINQDNKTFSINILILHGQSQSWYM